MSDRIRAIHGDSREVLKTLADNSVDSCVCDPPYALTQNKNGSGVASLDLTTPYGRSRITVGNGETGFMGQRWDTAETAHDPEFWRQVHRVLKPGAHVLAFGGTRTYHRLVSAVEDGGFEIRDQLAWLFGSGFPKSHDVSKALDRAAGVERENKFGGAIDRFAGPTGNKKCEKCGKWLVSGSPCQCPRPQDRAVTELARQWEGWGTALKPALEPIVLARKPIIGNVADNVLAHGTGAINVDACRIDVSDDSYARNCSGDRGHADNRKREMNFAMTAGSANDAGRWPANVVHDGSEEVIEAFPEGESGAMRHEVGAYDGESVTGFLRGRSGPQNQYGDAGSAARFFYTAKADSDDRLGSKHPTIKPIDLMQWLVRLVTPKGGIVLDPFAGTGTTGEAAWREGFRSILIEREPTYFADIERRISLLLSGPDERARESMKASGKAKPPGPLFGDVA